MSAIDPSVRINLKHALILVLEPNAQAMEVLGQILMGFGCRSLIKTAASEEARAVLESRPVDLVIATGQAANGADGYDLVHWLRRSGLDPNAHAPVILTGAHTSLRNVSKARDCGAHFFVAKPLAPATLIERIFWVARENRRFVEADAYIGPDRRFQQLDPAPGRPRRRSSDRAAAAAASASAIPAVTDPSPMQPVS